MAKKRATPSSKTPKKPAAKSNGKRIPKTRKTMNSGTNVTAETPVAFQYEVLCNWSDVKLVDLLELSEGIISKAIVRKNEIAFDWIDSESNPVQTTTLSSTDGVRFTGHTRLRSGDGDETAIIEAVLYSNFLGHILLGQGEWRTSGHKESFFLQFHSGKPLED